MRQIDNLSDDAHQISTVILDDGTSAQLTFNFLPAVQRWTIDVTYGNFIMMSMNLCLHPNLLRGWRNLIPFGIMCSTIDGTDPIYIDDFISGRVSLYILTAAEIHGIEESVVGAIVP